MLPQQLIKLLRKLQNASNSSSATSGTDLVKLLKHVVEETAAHTTATTTTVAGAKIMASHILTQSHAVESAPAAAAGGITSSSKLTAEEVESAEKQKQKTLNVKSSSSSASIKIISLKQPEITRRAEKLATINSSQEQQAVVAAIAEHRYQVDCQTSHITNFSLNFEAKSNTLGNKSGTSSSTNSNRNNENLFSSSACVNRKTLNENKSEQQQDQENFITTGTIKNTLETEQEVVVAIPNQTSLSSSVQILHKSPLLQGQGQGQRIGIAAALLQNLYQKQFQQQQLQQVQQFHLQHHQNWNAKQTNTKFTMSSLAAAEAALPTVNNHDENQQQQEQQLSEQHNPSAADAKMNGATECDATPTSLASSATGAPCFNTGLADIIQFMELIGNLKHTKRTGWVLRDVNDCESISGHMYRMSIMTFLLDGSEGLNQIRCMELALVHDLAESLVGDITPFCGVAKNDKRNMELKAMEEICKLIEPRGRRIMELFEEYEHGESAESKFVKDLDRLDMVMQAFEYEKRDNCLLKHQEFFDSTEGKFKHPFVKRLVDEIYEQRLNLAKARGAKLPPKINVPDMDAPSTSNGNSSIAPDGMNVNDVSSAHKSQAHKENTSSTSSR